MTNPFLYMLNKGNRSLLIERAKTDYNQQYDPDLWSRFPWDTELRGEEQYKTKKNVSLSKACLGEFMYHVLKRNGNVTCLFTFGSEDRSFVGVRVWLTLEARDDMMQNTKFALNVPPVPDLD